tara:strand:+ start:72 stop:404 length:333 start_codon:yes stop_codon:yes gene_type:complete
MVEFFSSGSKHEYANFKKNIPKQIIPLFDKLRSFCNSLDEKVIEDVRMHRVVFCKSMKFRWFADLEPTQTSILIKIQKDRKIPIKTIEVFPNQNITSVQNFLKDAYSSIH